MAKGKKQKSDTVLPTCFGLIILAMVGCLGAVIAFISYFESPSQPPPPTLTPYSGGTRVRLGEPGNGNTIGLWIFYEDECSADVVREYIPSGTVVTLTGDVCYDSGLYYKVVLPTNIKSEFRVSSDNRWVRQSSITEILN